MALFFKDLYHACIWQLSRLFVYAVLHPMFRVKIEKGSDSVPEAPFIMISNHGTFFDPWLVGGFSATPLSIMMNDDGFRAGRFTRWYLTSVGAFPKKKGAHDFAAMKKTLNTLKRGKAVLIFPEGQTTWDGKTQPIFGGIEKIAKKAGVNLCMAKVTGNFMSKPWWAYTRRKGSVRIRFKTISREQIADMSAPQILQTMIDYIQVNDIEEQRHSHSDFTGNDLARGVERLVWLCPHCKTEDCLVTRNNTIRCDACSLVVTMDARCKLFYADATPNMPENLYEWMRMHRSFVQARLLKDPSPNPLTSSSDVLMQRMNEAGEFVRESLGTLRLTSDALSFIPTDNPDREKTWPLSVISNYVIQKKDIVEFRHTETEACVRFVFDHKSPMKWIYYLRYLNGFDECERKGYM